MAAVTRDLNRRVGVLVDRAGRIEAVTVGDAKRITVPRQPSAPAGRDRFCTLRFLATRRGDGSLSPGDLAPLALHRLDALAIIAVADNGLAEAVRVAHLLPAGRARARRSEASPRRRDSQDAPGAPLAALGRGRHGRW
jgi:GTP-binding protein HflX